MYHIFQQQNEASSILFNETCDTMEDLQEIIDNPTYPIMFVYDDIENKFSHLHGYYDIDECFTIVRAHLNL